MSNSGKFPTRLINSEPASLGGGALDEPMQSPLATVTMSPVVLNSTTSSIPLSISIFESETQATFPNSSPMRTETRSIPKTPEIPSSDALTETDQNSNPMLIQSKPLAKNASRCMTRGLYSATYSAVPVWEIHVHGVDVMRRCVDSWLNATQLLKVAQIDKPHRTKILEREIQIGIHEKIQGGYGKYQGTWVPFHRGVEIAEQFGVSNLVRILIDYEPIPGSSPPPAPRRSAIAVAAAAAIAASAAASAAASSTNASIVSSNKSCSSLVSSQTTSIQNSSSSITRKGSELFSRPSTMGSRVNTSNNTGRAPRGRPPGSNSSTRSRAAAAAISAPGNNITQSSTRSNTSNIINSPGISMGNSSNQNNTINTTISKSISKTSNNTLNRGFGNFGLCNAGLTSFGVGVDRATSPPEWRDEMIQALLKRSEMPTLLINPPIDWLPAFPLDNQGHTALHWASALSRIDCVTRLLDLGHQKHYRANDGTTPVMWSVRFDDNLATGNFHSLLQLLLPLSLITSPETFDSQGNTVLHHIAMVAVADCSKLPAAEQYLQLMLSYIEKMPTSERRQFIDLRNNEGHTALLTAAHDNCIPVARVLAAAGASISDLSNSLKEQILQRPPNLTILTSSKLSMGHRTNFLTNHVSSPSSLPTAQESSTKSAGVIIGPGINRPNLGHSKTSSLFASQNIYLKNEPSVTGSASQISETGKSAVRNMRTFPNISSGMDERKSQSNENLNLLPLSLDGDSQHMNSSEFLMKHVTNTTIRDGAQRIQGIRSPVTSAQNDPTQEVNVSSTSTSQPFLSPNSVQVKHEGDISDDDEHWDPQEGIWKTVGEIESDRRRAHIPLSFGLISRKRRRRSRKFSAIQALHPSHHYHYYSGNYGTYTGPQSSIPVNHPSRGMPHKLYSPLPPPATRHYGSNFNKRSSQSSWATNASRCVTSALFPEIQKNKSINRYKCDAAGEIRRRYSSRGENNLNKLSDDPTHPSINSCQKNSLIDGQEFLDQRCSSSESPHWRGDEKDCSLDPCEFTLRGILGNHEREKTANIMGKLTEVQISLENLRRLPVNIQETQEIIALIKETKLRFLELVALAYDAESTNLMLSKEGEEPQTSSSPNTEPININSTPLQNYDPEAATVSVLDGAIIVDSIGREETESTTKKYRRIVSRCSGVPEELVDSILDDLEAALDICSILPTTDGATTAELLKHAANSTILKADAKIKLSEKDANFFDEARDSPSLAK